MNTLEDKIQKDLANAIKERNNGKADAIRSIKTAIMQVKTAAVNRKTDLTDTDIEQIIRKLAKQRSEAAEIYKSAGRNELAEKELSELEILNAYLPKMLSEEEIKQDLKKIIADVGATSMKEMGKVMGIATKHFAGKAEGGTISKIVKEILNN